MGSPPADFESAAYTIPPHRQAARESDDSVAGPEGAGGRERRNECRAAADAAGACRRDRGRVGGERGRSAAPAGGFGAGRGPARLSPGPQRDQRARGGSAVGTRCAVRAGHRHAGRAVAGVDAGRGAAGQAVPVGGSVQGAGARGGAFPRQGLIGPGGEDRRMLPWPEC
ncbi:hypothetical protein G6F57_017883 [Rhizopus arrhizus]|nr:hypothetical protein G6F57_017883 [Rhizopus arrhizus]